MLHAKATKGAEARAYFYMGRRGRARRHKTKNAQPHAHPQGQTPHRAQLGPTDRVRYERNGVVDVRKDVTLASRTKRKI